MKQEYYCSKCKTWKIFIEFSRCSTNVKYERQRYCKECRSHYYKTNRDRANATARAYYAKNYGRMYDPVEGAKRIAFRRSKTYRHTLKTMGFCSECGSTSQLCVHHIDRNFENNALDNLTVMCRPCHSAHHSYRP